MKRRGTVYFLYWLGIGLAAISWGRAALASGIEYAFAQFICAFLLLVGIVVNRLRRWWLRRTRRAIKIAVSPSGEVQGIYDDSPGLVGLMEAIGPTSIRRASHVEPTPDNRWAADMGPMGGPVLESCTLRGQALAAEVAWLKRKLFNRTEEA